MREGWEIKTIGEVCEIYNGGTPSTNIPEYWDGGIQWITPKDMGKSKEMYVSHCERTITQEGVEHSSAKVLPERSVIVSSRAPIGYVAINEVPMATNQGCKGFVLGKEIYPEFLYYFLLSSTELLNKLGTGATFKEVAGKKLAGIELPLPSLPEQQRIVDILDREFAKIDALKANAEKSLQAAKDLFQATTDTLMSNEQWRELTIGEIAKIKGGKRVPKGYKLEKEPTAHRYIRVADFTDLGTIRTESVLYISDEVYKSIKAYTISSKDVYISIAGTIGKSGIIPDTLDGANLTENACKLVLGPNFYNRFVFFATKTSSFKKQVEALTMQAAQPKLALTRLATIRVRVPSSIKEQETIVERLDGIADTIALLQDNYQKTLTLCDDLKQSLLRKAFIGEL